MLPQKNRIKKQKDFEKIFKQGRAYKEKELFVKVLKREDSNLRFGFVVSKKVSNKAVQRNKVKRRMREIVRSLLPNIKKGYDVVLVALPGLEKYDFWELQEIILSVFQKAGIIIHNE